MSTTMRILSYMTLLVLAYSLEFPVIAQGFDSRDTYPEQYTMSPGGVNVQTGRFIHEVTDIAIGDLKFVRSWGRPNWSGGSLRAIGLLSGFNHAVLGWNHNLNSGTKNVQSESGHLEIFVEGRRYKLYNQATGAMVPSDSASVGTNGVKETNGWFTFTDHSGAIHQFAPHAALTEGGARRLSKSIRPDGTEISYSYRSTGQVEDVRSTRGYGIHLDYDANGNVSKVCGYNLTQAYRAPAAACTTGLPTTTYSYTNPSNGHLANSTAPDGSVTNYQYYIHAGNYRLLDCVSLPNSSTCRIKNYYGATTEYPLSFVDQVTKQVTAAGVVWTYGYEPAGNPIDVPVIPGAPRYSWAWVFGPGGGSFTYDRGLLVEFEGEDGVTNYKYPQSVIVLGGLTIYVRDPRPALTTLPGGYREFRLQSGRGLILTHTRWPLGSADPYTTSGQPLLYPTSEPEKRLCCIRSGTPVDPAGYIKYSWAYLSNYSPNGFVVGCGAGATDAKRCSQPIQSWDPKGNSSVYSYSADHGGILTETGPAVNGVTPQKRYTYVQRYAWYRNSSGSYAQAPSPVWLLDKVSYCKTGNPSGSGCALAGDEVVTRYEYGANNGPNNLELRGVVEDATGAALRTCYSYDWRGNRISETKPRGTSALTACP